MKSESRRYDLEDRLIEFAAVVIDVVEEIPATRAGNHIAGQLVRSGTSPAPNYGEAQSAESKRDFVHKMKVAFKELRETRVWLRLILRKSYANDRRGAESVMAECEELIRIFWKSIATAQANSASIV
jgi:four helix bundle protein